MSQNPRAKWETRYQSGDIITEPSSFVEVLDPFIAPLVGATAPRALDVAGGAGRHAIWLAARGFDVTLVDISPTALSIAEQHAAGAGLALQTIEADLATDPLPPGPWDLVFCFHYLHRPLFPRMIRTLTPGGVLVYAIATVRNLERHERPPRPFLLEEGEAPSLAIPLEVVYEFEGWTDSDRHEARIIARKPDAQSAPGG